MDHKKGTLYGVGAGCGDPYDLTVRAIKTIENSDVVFFPAGSKDNCRAYDIVKDAVPGLSDMDMKFFDFPMVHDRQELSDRRKAIYDSVREYLSAGKDAAFITIGDPLIYSTFSYIAGFASSDGFYVEIINGIPSFLSCAAKLSIILGKDNEEIHIIPGSADIPDSLALPGMKIYMKLGKHFTDLRDALSSDPSHTFLGAVSHCGMPDEEIYHDITDIPAKQAYLMTAFVR